MKYTYVKRCNLSDNFRINANNANQNQFRFYTTFTTLRNMLGYVVKSQVLYDKLTASILTLIYPIISSVTIFLRKSLTTYLSLISPNWHTTVRFPKNFVLYIAHLQNSLVKAVSRSRYPMKTFKHIYFHLKGRQCPYNISNVTRLLCLPHKQYLI